MSKELKVGDKVAVMDKCLLMLQKFAPPGAKPSNVGVVSRLLDEDTVEVEFPIGNDDPEEHSQVAPYPKSICHLIK